MQNHSTSRESTRTRNHGAHRAGMIVVACDGTDNSTGALVLARELARETGGGLEVVSVLEPTNVIIPPLQRDPTPLHRGTTRVRDRRDRLRVLCRKVLGGDPHCPTRILIGDPPSSIARAAQSHAARLVVMGRRPHGRIDRAMRRETPLATARAGNVPVLSVPPVNPRLPRCAVVAVGEGKAAARLAPIVPALFREALAVHLVTVVPRPSMLRNGEARGDGDQRERAAQQALASATTGWSLPASVAIEKHVLTGEPGAALASFVVASGADLVVIGQSHRMRSPRRPIANLATRIFRTADCATLVVPVDRHAVPELEASTSLSRASREWPALLRDFTHRNRGRAASLSIDEHGGPPRPVVEGWTLSGIDCDPATGAIAIMLADPADATRHLSHMIAQPVVVAIHDGHPGSDELLVIGYDGGQITLALS